MKKLSAVVRPFMVAWLCILVIGYFMPIFAAASPPPLQKFDLPSSPAKAFPQSPDFLPSSFINIFILPILTVFVFLAIFYIIRAGIQFVRSSGDPKVVADAKSRLTWVIVGLIILILAYSVTQLADRLILGNTGVFR